GVAWEPGGVRHRPSLDAAAVALQIGQQSLFGVAGDRAGRPHPVRGKHRSRGDPMSSPAIPVTADGEVCRGGTAGAAGVTTVESTLNTAMTGYQEILTDPSDAGQVVVMTSSHIGNYGVTDLDAQSSRPSVSGFVMRAMARRHSNWRAQGSLEDYLRHH